MCICLYVAMLINSLCTNSFTGRTGVLVACHLIFSDHITADQAVAHVRSKR